jgi:hypothetical protein
LRARRTIAPEDEGIYRQKVTGAHNDRRELPKMLDGLVFKAKSETRGGAGKTERSR